MPGPAPFTRIQYFGMGLTVALALGLNGFMWHASAVIHGGQSAAHWRDIAVLTFGVACGWLAGTVASPAASTEWNRFVKFGTVLCTFLSGYVLSKADPLIAKMLTPAQWQAHGTLSFRALMWATAFVSSTMATFVLRSYFVTPHRKNWPRGRPV